MKKLIFFDIDGTLLNYKNHKVPKSTIKALEILKKKSDIKIIISTGRSKILVDDIEELSNIFDSFSYLNSASVVSNGIEIYKHIIAYEDKLKLFNIFSDLEIIYGFSNNNQEYISETNQFLVKGFENSGLKVPPIGNLLEIEDVSHVYFFGNEDIFKKVAKRVEGFRVVPWVINGGDLIPNHLSKAHGIEMFLKQYNLDKKDTYAFGDGYNDIEMLKFVGTGIAMGNSRDEVKKAADYVTDSIENDGIYNALKHFKLI